MLNKVPSTITSLVCQKIAAIANDTISVMMVKICPQVMVGSSLRANLLLSRYLSDLFIGSQAAHSQHAH